LAVDSDYGDTWEWYMKYLNQHGTDEKKEEVLDKCTLVDPKHGEVWARIAKDPKNSRKSTAEVLKMAVDQVE